MKQKLDELTYIGGSNIRDFVFKFYTAIIVLICGMGIVEAVMTGNVELGDMHLLIGIMPFALVGLIYPIQIYTKNYHQKAKFYMIKLKDVYYYHLKEFFNVKNVAVFVVTALIYDIAMTQILHYPLLFFFTQIAMGFAISPLFVAIGFYITTIYCKGYKGLRIALYIITYVISIPIIAISMIFVEYYFAIVACAVVGLLGVFLISLLVGLQEKKLEV